MPLITYVPKTFRGAALATIQQANVIIAQYQAQGFVLTLRQLYYQFVSRDLIPNNIKEYKRLGDVINDARLAGLIDWEAIEDRTRNLEKVPTWDGPETILEACARQFRLDLWANQTYRPEVWIEKEALVGVIEGVCNELRVPYLACRGYTSQSEMWSGAMRLQRYCRVRQRPVIFYFGDHDPSGIDMTRDVEDRMRLFGADVEVRRLALNMEQVNIYNPPPNPAKLTDSRAEGYIRTYGDDSWELDALEPNVIVNTIRNAVAGIRDDDAWNKWASVEGDNRDQLQAVSDRWDDVTMWLQEG